jgi:phage gpG-like protein
MVIVKMLWKGPQFLKQLYQHEGKNLERACIFLKNDIKKTLGVKSGPCNDKGDRQAKGSTHKGKKRSEGEYNRSQPGEPPHLQCGELRRSMAHEVDKSKMVGRVGSNKVYARYLELGTRRMAKRPFLKVALLRNRNTIKRILTLPFKG